MDASPTRGQSPFRQQSVSPSPSSVPDPSASIKRYLTSEAREVIESLLKASESMVVSSEVGPAVNVTAKRMLQAERHIDNTAMLLHQMERAVFQLDVDICKMVESVTKLEDVADQLASVECSQLYGVMKQGVD